MKPKIILLYLLYASLFLMIAPFSFGQLTKVWENHYVSRYDSNLVYVNDGTEYSNKLQFDGAGNCFFLSEIIPPSTDNTRRMNHPQMQVIKYNASGATVWIHKDTGNYYHSCDFCGLYPLPYQMIVHNDGTFFSLASESADWLGYYLLFLASTKSTGITTWDTSTLINQYYSNIAEDYKGNLIVVANSNANWSDFALSKVSSAGNILWSYLYGSPDGYSQSAFPKVATDKSGNSYVLHSSAGQFPDTANAWLSKFDTSGSLIWDKELDSGIGISQSPPSVLYNTTDSCLYATYQIVTNDTSYGNEKLLKITTSGVINWQKSISVTHNFLRLKQDKQGNVYWWTGVQDYGYLPYPDRTDEGDIFKYNSAGTLIGLMHGNSFDLDASGYTYTTNYFFDSKTYNRYDNIRKYSPVGTLLYDTPASLTNDDNYFSELYLNGSNIYTLKAYDNFDTVSVTKYNATCSAKAAPAKPKSITGSATMYCNNTTYSYSCPAVSKAIYYNWAVPTGVIIDSGQGTTKLYVHHSGTGFKTGQVSVYAANCFGASAAVFKSVTDTLKPVGKITGPTSVCKGQMNVEYSVPVVAGAIYYHWSIPADAAFSIGYGGSGDEGNSVQINFGNTSGKVSVYAVNYCDSSVVKSLQVKVTACASAEFSTSLKENKTIVYPNPSSSTFTLKLRNVGNSYNQDADIIVKDVTSKTVEQLKAGGASTVRFGGKLLPGMYIVEVITKSGKEVFKIIKQ